MNDIYNADIQEAPVYPVSFQLYDKDGNPIYRLQSECNLSTVIYIPEPIANSFSGQDNFIHNWREYPHFDKWGMNRPLI